MTHAELLDQIQLHLSTGDTRLLRANVGRGWIGKVISQTPQYITLSPYRAFHGMPEGVLDLIGFAGARYVEIDGKVGRDKARPAQQRRIELIQRCGGLAGIAYSVEDAIEIIRGYSA